MACTILTVPLNLRASIYPKDNNFGFNLFVDDEDDNSSFEFEDDLFDIIHRFIDQLNDVRLFEDSYKESFKNRLLETIQRIQ